MNVRDLEDFKPFKVNVIDDKEFLKRRRNEIFTLVQNAYSNKGGFLGGDNPRTLIKNTDRAKIVFDDNGEIIACSLYWVDRGGFKRFGSAGISGNPESLKAVEDIIKTDIEPYNNWYWVEASGAIEHLYKKNGGNPIPNWIVGETLGMSKEDRGFRIDETDEVHYFRLIRGVEKRKMMFGFKDEETKNRAFSVVKDYAKFKLDVNQSSGEMVGESGDVIMIELERARKFICGLFDLHYEDGFNEMLPEWQKALLQYMDMIEDNMDKIPDGKRRMYLASLDRAETCLEEMDVIAFRKIEV